MYMPHKLSKLLLGFIACILCIGLDVLASGVFAATEAAVSADWPTVGANPQRTSWTPEEIPGVLRPIWYRPIDPYINYKIQIIAAHDTLYVSTARGLYALSTNDIDPSDGNTLGGDVKWVYPTELPIGHSPTVEGNVVYFGGYDRRLVALDAAPDLASLPVRNGVRVNDQVLWSFEAQAGFETNPLVVNNTVYAGSRDGYLYAINATTGQLVWTYPRQDEPPLSPILFSAAYKDNVIYFASNDSYAYAVDAENGELVWRSAKLPGQGFHSYWPVIYEDWVVLAGSNNYRGGHWTSYWPSIGSYPLTKLEIPELYPDHDTDPRGTPIGTVGREPGPWAPGTVAVDVSRIVQYLEKKPWRRTHFVLDRYTGTEYTFDSDGDGRPEYAPIAWCGTYGGNRYPPVVGGDGVLYQMNNYLSDPWIPGGMLTGWKFGTQFVSRVSGDWAAIDEPHSYSAGGNLIYWANMGDREAGAFDITVPQDQVGREWKYFDYDLQDRIPGYQVKYFPFKIYATGEWTDAVYGSYNGVYHRGSNTQNPPIPYKGVLYMQKGNSIVAFGPVASDPVGLPLVPTVPAESTSVPFSTAELEQKLATEVTKILMAGHLRPGYHSTGVWDYFQTLEATSDGDYLSDYWHNPSDTLYTLLRALPHLPPDLQQQTRAYLEREFSDYPPYDIAHVGWSEGAPREDFDLPPEIEALLPDFGPRTTSLGEWNKPTDWWSFPQHSFYGLWKYAEEFGGASEIFGHIENKIELPPSDSYLADFPHIHNAYIAGYIGYLELEELAGRPESTDVRSELDRLLALRANTFTKTSPFMETEVNYRRVLNISRNFMYLVPELSAYLREHAYSRVQEAVDEYQTIAPGWFVAKYDVSYSENTLQPLYDYHSLFQAKAQILQEPREELVKYLDVPAFARGDLFYIQNLVAALEAPHSLEKTASVSSGDQDSTIRYTLNFFGRGAGLELVDELPEGVGAPSNFVLVGTGVTPSYNSQNHLLTWSDSPAAAQEVTISYDVRITIGETRALVNVATLSGSDGETSIATTSVLANPNLAYLPLVFRSR